MQALALSRLTLGLDIGSASIGWALIDPQSQKIEATGVRIFDAGVDAIAFEKGQPGASNNTVRRQKRLQRRQFRRRAGRQRELFLALQEAGLLPSGTSQTGRPGRSEVRHAVLSALDQQLRLQFARDLENAVTAPAHVLPYYLRARALDQPLPPYALGRALYHLGQRRGFQSNRRSAAGEAEEKKQASSDAKSDVKTSIATLQHEIDASDARTLGEYFARQDPSANRLRDRWTGRAMFTREFELIWAAQSPHHVQLTSALRERIQRLLFFQRPIRSGKVGMCEHEAGSQRAPIASLTAQRFRLLQKLNDLRVVDPYLNERELADEERRVLVQALESTGDLTFVAIRKRGLVHLKRGERFNLETGGEKRLIGNRTASKLGSIFGQRWDQLSQPERDRIVGIWIDVESADELTRIGLQQYGLSQEVAEKWAGADCQPEEGYAKLSLKAMRRLLPLLEQGVAFKSAEMQIYGGHFSGGTAADELPPVSAALPQIPNPAVQRALTELRKLVNAIVREYGKPWEIRIELARDLKRNSAQRAVMWKRMRMREADRRRAEQNLKLDLGLPRVSGRDLEIALLFGQAKGICPYCGQALAMADMFNSGLGQVDHILPRNRFPDDSFANKCIAHVACNREKLGRTPHEAYGQDPDRWSQILERVRKWDDDGKLRAFQVTSADFDLENENSFASRRLNETRYATTMAARYLGQLYGGRDVERGDGTRRRVIFASSGMATATLRRAWRLESILRQPEASADGHSQGKPRHDHRHHAIDAIVVALTTNATIQHLSLANAAAAAATGSERISSRSLCAPWPDFVDRVRPAIQQIVVSHRPDHKLAGELHMATNYSKPHVHAGHEYVHLRVPVADADPDRIVDPAVADAVRQKLVEVGDAGKLEFDPPHLGLRPIRKVRVRMQRPAAASVSATRAGSVQGAANHHIEFFAGRDDSGRDAWKARIVSRWEANLRHARQQQLINREFDEPGFEFIFSLMARDSVEMQPRGGGNPKIYRLLSISDGDLEFAPHNEAIIQVKKNDGGASRNLRQRQRADGRITNWRILLQRGCRKVTVDALGRVRGAGD